VIMAQSMWCESRKRFEHAAITPLSEADWEDVYQEVLMCLEVASKADALDADGSATLQAALAALSKAVGEVPPKLGSIILLAQTTTRFFDVAQQSSCKKIQGWDEFGKPILEQVQRVSSKAVDAFQVVQRRNLVFTNLNWPLGLFHVSECCRLFVKQVLT